MWWDYIDIYIYIYMYIYLYMNQTMGIFCKYYISGSSLLNSFCFQRYGIPTEKYVADGWNYQLVVNGWSIWKVLGTIHKIQRFKTIRSIVKYSFVGAQHIFRHTPVFFLRIYNNLWHGIHWTGPMGLLMTQFYTENLVN